MSQEEVLRLVARARDDASPALRKIRESLAAVKEGSAGPRDATRHLKLMHEEGARGATELKRHYRELREHLDKLSGRITQGLEPAFVGLNLKGLAATGVIAGLAAAVRSFADSGADLDAFSRKVRLSVDTIRGLEGVADKFHIDPNDLRQSEQALVDSMYRIRKHRGEFYAYLKAQRPEDAEALAATKDTVAGNEQALQLWLKMLERIQQEHGEAAARLFSKEALGTDAFVDMLQKGTAGLAAAVQEHNRLTGAIDVSKGKAFAESLSDFQAALEGLRNAVGESLLPEFTKGVRGLSEAVKEYGPGFATGMVDAYKGLKKAVSEAWPVVKNALDEADPYVQKIGGWKVVFEGLAAIRLVSFAAQVTGLATSVRVLAAAIELLPAGARGVFGLAGAAAAGASAESTPNPGISADPAERQKQIEENRRLTDEYNKAHRQGPYAPSDAETHEEFQRKRQNLNPLFHRSSFTDGMGGGLLSAHSEFEEAVARGTAAGVVKGLSDFAGLQSMNAKQAGPAGVQNASYTTNGSENEGEGGARAAVNRRRASAHGVDGATVETGGSGAGNLTKLIEEVSRNAGIDPRIMEGIRAGESGHGSRYDKKDDALESSWGPFQLNRRRGLGVQFEKETGLDVRDPSTIAAQARWVANFIRKGGSLGNWMGYHGPRDADPRWGDSGYKPNGDATALPAAGSPPTRFKLPPGGYWATDSHGHPVAVDKNGVSLGPDGRPARVLPPPGETSRKSDESRTPVQVHGSGELSVKVQAPRGTQVAASGGGLFKKVTLNRGYSMTQASEVG